MGGSCTQKYALVLIWAFVSFAAAMLCFYNGFFLQRKALTSRSPPCQLPSSPPFCRFPGMSLCTAPRNPQFNRLVLIIIDALRYDFLDPTSSMYPDEVLPIAKKLEEEEPSRTVISRLVADPPTTTMQRVKALMTGTFPTFIDAGSNFFSYAVEEDSLLTQWKAAGKSIGFVGDDTWTEMFPDVFDESLPCPSFDIMDLDSVDSVVRRRLFDEFERDDKSNVGVNETGSKRHDIIIGHFLGVDHAGHRHGRGHPEMRRKLREMDAVLTHLVQAIDDETLLVVLGDHGMTATGDHGGDTDDEVDAGLLVYSKTANFGGHSPTKSSSQIDLVPTLAWLTGVPIPLSNVGTIIWNLLPVGDEEDVTRAAAANYLQVEAFLENYPLAGFPADDRKRLKKLADQITAVSCEEDGPSRLANLTEATEWRISFLTLAKRMCRKAWVDFDTVSMTNGLVFALLTLCSWTAVCLVPASTLSDVFQPALLVLLAVGTVGIIAGTVSVQFAHWIPDNLAWSAIFATSCGCQALILSNVVKRGKVADSKRKSSAVFPVVALLLYAFSFSSNSFVINEDSVTAFLLVTFVLLEPVSAEGRSLLEQLRHRLRQSSAKKKSKSAKSGQKKASWINGEFLSRFLLAAAVGILARASLLVFRRCREEKYDSCEAWITHKPTGGLQSEIERRNRFLSAVATLVFVTGSTWWFRLRGSFGENEVSLRTLIVNYFPWFNCFCLTCFWCSFLLPKRDWVVLTGKGVGYVYAFPAAVFVACAFGSVVVVFSSSFYPNRKRSGEEIAAVQAFLNLAFFQSAAVLVGDAYVTPFAALFVTLYLLSSFETEYILGWERVVALAFASSAFFFATGHQASFVALQWESAFVFGPLSNNLASGAAILLNTYSVYLLAAFFLPSLVISGDSLGDFGFGEQLFKATSVFLAFFMLRLFGCAVAAAVLKRHLMVWKIFGPRFLFEFVGFLVVGFATAAVSVVAAFVVSRIGFAGTRCRHSKLP